MHPYGIARHAADAFKDGDARIGGFGGDDDVAGVKGR